MKSRWRALTYLKERDNYGKDVPSFNISGETQVNTVLGGFLTIVVTVMTLGYALLKFVDVSQGKDPNIRQNLQADSFGPEDKLNFFDDLNFRFAVGALFYNDHNKTLKHDPQIVRWIARMVSKDDKGYVTITMIPLHDCTD